MINDRNDHAHVVEWNLSDLEEDAFATGSLLHHPGVRGERLPVHHRDDDDGEGDGGEGDDDVVNHCGWPVRKDYPDHDCDYGGNVNDDDDDDDDNLPARSWMLPEYLCLA